MPESADLYYHLYEGEEKGKRLPVVLIHGAAGSHLSWPPEMRRLSGRRVYALDLPGHGKSKGRSLQSISAISQAIMGWLEALEIQRAVFIGHSMGSAVAISLALDHPEVIGALGLLGAGSQLSVNPRLIEAASKDSTFLAAVDTVVRWSFSEKTPEKLTTLVRQRMAETRPTVLHGDFLACDAFDETSRISQIKQPVLLMCGEEDKMTPARLLHALAGELPQAVLKTIPGAGHMVMLEQPKVVAAIIQEFLDTLPRR